MNGWARRSAGLMLMLVTAALLGMTGCAGFFVDEDGSGGGGNNVSNTGDYVYAVNRTTNTMSAYTIGTGTLTQISGSPYNLPTNLNPVAVAVSGKNTFVYVAGNGSIFGYSIATNGALTPISGGALLAQVSVASLDASPDGNWLAGLDTGSQVVDEFQINLSTGILTPVTYSSSMSYPAVFNGPVVPTMIRFSPEGNFLVAALGTAGDAVFSFNANSGLITYLSAIVLTGSTSANNAVAFSSNDSLLYVASSGVLNGGPTSTSGVYVFSLSTSNGTSGGNTLYPGGAGASSIVVDSTGGYLYTGNKTDQTISEFSVASGVLTPLSTPTLTGANYVTSLARDRTGSYILAGSFNGSTDLTMYSMSSGVLTSVASVATGTDSIGLQIATTH